MGDLLLELEHTLRSSKEQLTGREDHLLYTCKSRAIKDFTIGAVLGSCITWAATRRLSFGYRFHCSGGAAVLSGIWSFDRSLNSCLNQILELDGTRMQSVLANIILTKHHSDSRKVQLVKKHFYSEKVFDDMYIEKPLSRWRPRNYFGDGASEETHEETSIDKPDELEPKQFTVSSSGIRKLMADSQTVLSKWGFSLHSIFPLVHKTFNPLCWVGRGYLSHYPPRTTHYIRPPRAFLSQKWNPVEDATADPFDCIFGNASPSEEIHHSDSTNDTPRSRSRSHKRAHRRHQSRHLEI